MFQQTETRMPFGKYKDMPLMDVPSDYLDWCLTLPNLDHRLRLRIQEELADRDAWTPPPPSPPPPPPPSSAGTGPRAVLRETIDRWQRKMAGRYHTDRGGTLEAM